MLRVDDEGVHPAAIDGSLNNAFVAQAFVFRKPR